MIIDATHRFESRHFPVQSPPAPPDLVWNVMGRLNKCDRRRVITHRWIAATGLVASAWVIHHHRSGRS